MTGRTRGRRVVLLVYGVVVAVAATLGYVIGLIQPADLREVAILGVWTVAPTPVGLALYGSITVATVLGVGLGLVVLVSRRADAERPA